MGGSALYDSYLALLEGLTGLVAVLILITGLDDLLIDIIAHGRRIYRRFFIYSRHPRLTEDDLSNIPEKPIAIMIPAWQEATIIRRMLENACATFDYTNYRIFVGLYPNDPDSLHEVEAAARRFPQIIPIVGDTPGPTNKADCLNSIYAGIETYEAAHECTHEAFVMHDAEDVVHPLELRLFNYLIPRKDMMQLPVVALERPVLDFTGGHYMDEFAEFHAKDLVVREWLMGSVPCAGVGCGFSRKAMAAMADTRPDGPFNRASLTEDYDFAFTLNRLGLSQIFVRFEVLRHRDSLSEAALSRRKRYVKDLVGTREFFPDDVAAAYRQKARWLLGIVFQNWASNRWQGPWRMKYALFRDRKGIMTANLAIVAYFIALNFAVLVLLHWIRHGVIAYPPIITPGGWIWTLLLINGGLLFNRSLHRAAYTYKIYGLAHGLMAVPRQIWGNVINFLASSRALWLFLNHRLTGKPLAWEKTAHAFPSTEELRPFQERLGQKLKDKGLISERQLAIALSIQRRRGIPLGQALLAAGHIDELGLYQTLAEQYDLSFVDLTEPQPPTLYRTPMDILRAYRVLPIRELADGSLLVATDRSLTDDFRSEVGRVFHRPLSWALATPSEIDRRLNRTEEALSS